MSKHDDHYAVQPGRLITPTTIVLALIVAIAFAIIAIRFFVGLGPVSNMSDGYPWGLWLGYDVATGTAFACGGYVLAITVYVFNGFKYHPMVRSAVVASMFGYALGGFSVMVDIGRYWNAWAFFVPTRWQPNSVMFEVALCIMAYCTVLIIEFLPAVLEKVNEINLGLLTRFTKWVAPKLDKILFLFIALGVTLPTMHQSSLGSMFIITGPQLHGLWQTNFLPLLFITNAIMMGFSIVMFESGLSSVGFKRPFEYEALDFTKLIAYVGIVWLVIRFATLIFRGNFLLIFTSGFHSVMFICEIGLIAAGTWIMLKGPGPRKAFYAAMMLCIGGGWYRMNVYLMGFDPGPMWNAYFPSFAEFFVTFGLIALEILGYIVLCKLLKLLPKPHSAH
jgi:Ni/Fe-hydrogenase subunit HybB-like protein